MRNGISRGFKILEILISGIFTRHRSFLVKFAMVWVQTLQADDKQMFSGTFTERFSDR